MKRSIPDVFADAAVLAREASQHDVRTLKWAAELCGSKLTVTSKMPCDSFGTPTSDCSVGQRLARVAGSTCSLCYADGRGRYSFDNVKQAQLRRLDAWRTVESSLWVAAMVRLIRGAVARRGAPYMRWFDSGDLQGPRMLRDIASCAILMPDVVHWLPTKEAGLIRSLRDATPPPSNLLVRVSAAMIDGSPPTRLPSWARTSTVHKDNAPFGVTCVAPQQARECRECRACWNYNVANVSYKLH